LSVRCCVADHRGGLLRAAVHAQQRGEPVAEPEEPDRTADGPSEPVQTEAPGQVLCGTTSHTAGTDQVYISLSLSLSLSLSFPLSFSLSPSLSHSFTHHALTLSSCV